MLGNNENAEDALQEGLLAAFRNLHRLEGRALLSTWLTRIVAGDLPSRPTLTSEYLFLWLQGVGSLRKLSQMMPIGGRHVLVADVDNGQCLVEAARELNPDLMIVDIGMPVLNGINAVRAAQGIGQHGEGCFSGRVRGPRHGPAMF